MVVGFSHLDTVITTVPYRAGDIPLLSARHSTLVETFTGQDALEEMREDAW